MKYTRETVMFRSIIFGIVEHERAEENVAVCHENDGTYTIYYRGMTKQVEQQADGTYLAEFIVRLAEPADFEGVIRL